MAALPWAGLGIGLLLTAVAVATLLGWRLGLPERQPVLAGRSGLRGALAFGGGDGLMSVCCALPLFLAVLDPAAPRADTGLTSAPRRRSGQPQTWAATEAGRWSLLAPGVPGCRHDPGHTLEVGRRHHHKPRRRLAASPRPDRPTHTSAGSWPPTAGSSSPPRWRGA